jgi:hypothetical protein
MILATKERILGMEFIHEDSILLIRAVGSNGGFIVCIE